MWDKRKREREFFTLFRHLICDDREFKEYYRTRYEQFVQFLTYGNFKRMILVNRPCVIYYINTAEIIGTFQRRIHNPVQDTKLNLHVHRILFSKW